jgi:DegV family protein with EDD domain
MVKWKEIDGMRLYYLFFYGRRKVQENQKHLNDINVFPVPDGDTGTNLVQTMHSIVEGSRAESSVSVVGSNLADAALSGSRGNSGIIFAQFVQGLSEAIKGKDRLHPREFVHAVTQGVDHAYKALSKPVEGTILTVMRAWANSLHHLQEKGTDFTENLHHSLAVAQQALKETPKQLKSLRAAGVVDAGAQGFVHFLEGMLHFVRHGRKFDSLIHTDAFADDGPHLESIPEEITFRYCTEVFIQGRGLDSALIREKVEEDGDSLIVAGSTEKVRVHVHTDHPSRVVQKLRSFGKLAQQKIDDMQRQFEDHHRRKARIALVTDSTCDLPGEIMDEYQIHFVPLNLMFGENTFVDKLSIEPDQFYEMLDEEPDFPKTSQPTVRQFELLYESLARTHDSIISIHLAEALSGTFNAAKQAAKKIKGTKISVIDSKVLTTSLGLILLRAAREIQNGRPHDEIVQLVESWTAKVKMLVSVATMKYFVKGGRVSPLKGAFAKTLNLKPIISQDADGRSIIAGKAIGSRANIRKILKMIRSINTKNKILDFAIGHAHVPEKASQFADQIRSLLQLEPSFTVDIGPALGAHAGYGTLCVSVITE